MLQNIIPAETIEEKSNERFFQAINEPTGCGYGFDCTENGNPIFHNESQKENYNYCITHPEKFKDLGVQERIRTYKEPAKRICHCGTKIYLTNQYLGACKCPECGQWYNLFGQELLPPEMWED